MKRDRQGGFTLLEVLIATAMLATAITLSMTTANLIISGEHGVKSFSKAHNIAVAQMEQLLANFGTNPDLTPGTHTQSYDKDGNLAVAGAGYTASWTVTADTPITKIMKIQLDVSWLDNGHQRGVHFLTFRQP